jgi:hypothetical protein
MTAPVVLANFSNSALSKMPCLLLSCAHRYPDIQP